MIMFPYRELAIPIEILTASIAFDKKPRVHVHVSLT